MALIRISAMFVSMPLFNIRAVPVKVRLVLSSAITLLIIPLLPTIADFEWFSYTGFLIVLQQVLIGLVIGFIVQMAFAAMVFAGQAIALSMGLGFSVMVDPQNGQQVPVISQFYMMLSTLLFFSMDAHLVLIKMLLDSFTSLPIGISGLDTDSLWTVVSWSTRMIAGGLLLSLPVVAGLLLINVCFGVAARAAPQLQIFSVGFPVSLMLGLILLWMTLPDTLQHFSGLLTGAYELCAKLLRV